MNRFIIAIGFLSSLLLHACTKEEFQYNMYKPTLADVDSVYFSAGDISLIADGQAQLKFIVEAYRRVKRDNASDTLMFIDYRELPEGSMKIMEAVSGKEMGMMYSTTTITQDTLKFYASIGSKQSDIGKVVLRPKPALPPKVYVDVIFHVWELNPANAAYEPASYQPVNYQLIVDALKVVNQVANNQISTNPNGASANVEFRLAAKNPAGQTMALPGYNKIVYSDEVKANPLAASISINDFPQYINKSPNTYIWTPEKYLNVHVLPAGSSFYLGNLFPQKQMLPGPGQQVIPGISGIAFSPSDYKKDFANATVFMPNTLFFPGYERRKEIFGYFGNFYGLISTSYYDKSIQYSDYCFDTMEYLNSDPRNNYNSPIKVGVNGVKFVSDYAMDDTRYPSGRNAITLDQVNRMRAVMARCPGRMNSYP